MTWDGVERRTLAVEFTGSDRRHAGFWRLPRRVTKLQEEQVRELANQRRRELRESWEAMEFLE